MREQQSCVALVLCVPALSNVHLPSELWHQVAASLTRLSTLHTMRASKVADGNFPLLLL